MNEAKAGLHTQIYQKYGLVHEEVRLTEAANANLSLSPAKAQQVFIVCDSAEVIAGNISAVLRALKSLFN